MTKPHILDYRPRLPPEASSANVDERRDNMADQPPHCQCTTCHAIIPRTNAGALWSADSGACFRIAFLISGMTDLTDPRPTSTRDNITRGETRNRPTVQERDDLLAAGKRWWDTTDIRNKQYWCRSHTHTLTMAPEILEHYGDSIENYRSMTPELLLKWFDDGSPVVDHKPVKLSNSMTPAPEETIPQIPDVYLEGYNPCANCTHYQRGMDETTGRGTPHKGICTYGSKNRGALQLISNEERTTYDFLSCSWFHMNPKRVDPREERPANLFSFTELNPMNEPPSLLESYYAHLPRAFLPAPLTEDDLVALDDHDLVAGVQSRMDEVDHLQFSKDFGFMPVATHFAKRIKQNSRTDAEHWSRYSHYQALGQSIYDTEPTPTEAEHE